MKPVRTAALAALLALGPTVVWAGEAAAHPVSKSYQVVGRTPGPVSKVFGKGFYQGYVNEPGNVMSIDACDMLADGKRVVVRVYNSSQSFKVQDADGAGNSCVRRDNVPHLIVGTMEVCRQEGAGGTPFDCDYSTFDYSYYWET
ncbi:hypothetical protein [Amycolatopsis solani]|uniref:hypothetical protein n=1 Tax=Amycolatopsis solani TaxID=3028615 RepID=UPI0025AF141F|nr:hypothetical protein [Amycolatopsis sp. MEP2-6]